MENGSSSKVEDFKLNRKPFLSPCHLLCARPSMAVIEDLLQSLFVDPDDSSDEEKEHGETEVTSATFCFHSIGMNFHAGNLK
jgi:hypothetical protein